MKTISFFITILILSTLSCSTTEKVNNEKDNTLSPNTKAIVSIDCTGKYIVIDKLSYHVCNEDKLKKYNDGDTIMITFKKIEKCTTLNGMVCEMYRENEGWVSITTVAK